MHQLTTWADTSLNLHLPKSIMFWIYCRCWTATNHLNWFFLNGPTPFSFFVYFQSFQTNINTIFTTNQCEKCPSSIQYWDSNPRPLEHESSPITTRPGLRPWIEFLLAAVCLTTAEQGKGRGYFGSMNRENISSEWFAILCLQFLP